MMKSEPASSRVKRLLEVLSAYFCYLNDMTGKKGLTLSEFLSGIKVNK